MKKDNSLLLYLLLLTGLFVFWQIAVHAYVEEGFFIVTILFDKRVHIPWIMLPADIAYLLAQMSLYLFFVIIVWSVTRLLSGFFKLTEPQSLRLGIIIWIVCVVEILLANKILYPESMFSTIFPFLSLIVTWYGLYLFSILLMLLGLSSFLALSKIILNLNHRIFVWMMSVCVILGTAGFYGSHREKSVWTIQAPQPNIIIIGLDALRPDRVGYYGYPTDNTPNLDKFLSQSTNFTNSLTPLARTFTAWASILTGQYPKHNHVRFNLINQEKLQLTHTLPQILKQYGYQTVYATDDERFSNISKRFGFDKIIGVPEGINDFVLGSINDFPLSNLMVNTKMGEWLFPYSFANREVPDTYNPDSFIHLLAERLQNIDPHQPLFLSVHFCLPHWPYRWASLNAPPSTPISTLYDFSIKRVDQQFQDFLNLLNQHHLLDHALVIVISDHGEAFGLPGDRLITEKQYIKGVHSHKDIFKQAQALLSEKEGFDTSTGHGTDVLSYTQYHNLLAFQIFGEQPNVKTKIDNWVSLVDIKPTILNWLGLLSPQTDGESLLPSIYGKKVENKPRMIFTEIGFTPTAIRTTDISIKNAAYQALDVFRIDPVNGHIVLQDQMVKQLLLTKQRAVYYGDWVLAFYPDNHDQLIPILVNRQTGKWTDDLKTTFAKHSPAEQMLLAMRRFYGEELNKYYPETHDKTK